MYTDTPSPELLAKVERAVRDRGGNGSGTELSFRCPCGDHKNGDQNPSATYNTIKGVWLCHKTGAGGGAVDLAERLQVGTRRGHCAQPPITRAKRIARARAATTTWAPSREPEASELIHPKLGAPTQKWPIRDHDGNLFGVHCRWDQYSPREIRWWRKGEWSLGALSSTMAPLYRSETLSDADTVVVLVEGEKAADALAVLGLSVVATVTGAGSTPDVSVFNVLRGRAVALWPDHDDVGRQHMRRVAEQICDVATRVRIFDPYAGTEAEDGSDAVEWLAERAEIEAVGALAMIEDDAVEVESQSSPTADPMALTDLGNAERLIAAHGNDLRYCAAWGYWLIWDGRRWIKDECRTVEHGAQETVRSILAEGSDEPDSSRRTEIAKHAIRSESAKSIGGMVRLAQVFPLVSVAPTHFDRESNLLNVENGVLNLSTSGFRQHDRRDLITKLAPVRYDTKAKASRWEEFLEEIFMKDRELIQFVQRAIGYSLTASTAERGLFILYGGGRNGKSTFVSTIAAVLGDYSSRTPTETLLARNNSGGIPNDVAALRGVRFVYAAEADQGRRLAEARIKDLTGGDTISARFLHGEFFEFRPQFKLWISTNHKPEIRGTDNAIWDRVRLIPFDVRFDDPDTSLGSNLLAERDGILAWAVKGCEAWRTEGLGKCSPVDVATKRYRAEMDVLAEFIEANCEEVPGGRLPRRTLVEEYNKWCERMRDRNALSNKALYSSFRERGFGEVKVQGFYEFDGIRLRDGQGAGGK